MNFIHAWQYKLNELSFELTPCSIYSIMFYAKFDHLSLIIVIHLVTCSNGLNINNTCLSSMLMLFPLATFCVNLNSTSNSSMVFEFIAQEFGNILDFHNQWFIWSMCMKSFMCFCHHICLQITTHITHI